MLTRISISLLLFLAILTAPKPLHALSKFSTKYQILYAVEESGKTHVRYVINQKNNLSVVYATEFSLSVNETKIENVKVLDEGKQVLPEVIKSLNQTSITFPFSSKVVGKDKNHTFTIEYDTTDVTTRSGSTWQIDIPRLELDESIVEQSVVLSVPNNFPDPAYIDPKPDIINGKLYYFSGQKISNKSISAVFGNTQYYQGKLDYHLTNPEKQKIRTEIALPPNTSYQTVYFEKITPSPDEIITDNDGNLLAKYTLLPGENKDISTNFIVKIDFQPKPTFTNPSDTLTSSNSIWNYDNGVFNTPELKNLVTPKAIYDFVSDKLKYDYQKLNREKPSRPPASESLINSQSAICTDFSNVFVALARKASIPTRELQGFAISDNSDLKPLSLTQDVLHSWPEYFDRARNTWYQIDPTWASTTRGIDYFNKLDFNHIVFVIHGLNPNYPVPAGGYKNGQRSKDIQIKPSDKVDFPSADFKFSATPGESGNIKITINNTTGVSYSGNIVVANSQYWEEEQIPASFLPYGNQVIIIKSSRKVWEKQVSTEAIIKINGNSYQVPITIGTDINKALFFTGTAIFLGIIAFIARHIYLRRRKATSTLHWKIN